MELPVSPVTFMMVPTLACQANCSYCYAAKTAGVASEAVTRSAVAFIERVAPKTGGIHLVFHGGEPLLAGADYYRLILPLLREIFGNRLCLSMQSNLWALDEDFLSLIREYRIGMGTSLDGDREICDSQRGEGYCGKTSAGLEKLRSAGIPCGIISTFASPSVEKAPEFIRHARGNLDLHGAVPVPDGQNNNACLNGKEMTRLLLSCYEAYRENNNGLRIKLFDACIRGAYRKKNPLCMFSDCLGKYMAIAPDGSVYPCNRFIGMEKYCLGNVLNGLMAEDILHSDAFALLKQVRDRKETACKKCPDFFNCHGGCLFDTLVGGGEKSPYCEAYRKLNFRITTDLALEMCSEILGREEERPLLKIARE